MVRDPKVFDGYWKSVQEEHIDSYETLMEPTSWKVRMCDVCLWRFGVLLCNTHLNSITKSHLPPTFIEFRLIEYIYMISLFGSFWCFVVYGSRQFCHSLFIQTHTFTLSSLVSYRIVLYKCMFVCIIYIIFFVAKCHSDTHTLFG